MHASSLSLAKVGTLFRGTHAPCGPLDKSQPWHILRSAYLFEDQVGLHDDIGNTVPTVRMTGGDGRHTKIFYRLILLGIEAHGCEQLCS